MDEDPRDKTGFKKAKYHWQVKRSRNLPEDDGVNSGPSASSTNSQECNMETDSAEPVANEPMGSPAKCTKIPATRHKSQNTTKDLDAASSSQTTGVESAEGRRGVKRQLSAEESAGSAPRLKHSVVWKRRNLIISSNDAQEPEPTESERRPGDVSEPSSIARTVPHIDRWQNLHIASAMVDNAINTTLEEIHASVVRGSSGPSPSARNQQRVVARGVDVAIQEHGLRTQAGAAQVPTFEEPSRASVPDPQPHSTISSLFSARCFKQMEDEYRAKMAAQNVDHSLPSQGVSRQRIRVSMLREALGLSGSSNPVNPETEGKVEVTFTRVVPLQKRRVASQESPITSSEVSQENVASQGSLITSSSEVKPHNACSQESPSASIEVEQDGATGSIVKEECANMKGAAEQEQDTATLHGKDTETCHPEDRTECSNLCTLPRNLASSSSVVNKDLHVLGATNGQGLSGAMTSMATLVDEQQVSASSVEDVDMVPAAERYGNQGNTTNSDIGTADPLLSDRPMEITGGPPDPSKIPSASFVLDQAVNAAILEKGLQF